MPSMLRMRRPASRVAVAAAAAFAAIALHGCEPDISTSQYNPDSGASVGDTTEETRGRTVITATYEGKPCIIKKNLSLAKGESIDLYDDISISMSSITLEKGSLMASLIVSARGEVPDGLRTLQWTSLAHLNAWEGNFKEFEMGLKGNILVSISVDLISQNSITFDISICTSD